MLMLVLSAVTLVTPEMLLEITYKERKRIIKIYFPYFLGLDDLIKK
jgi:hypothetical protein